MYYFIEIKDQIKEVLAKDPSELDKHTLENLGQIKVIGQILAIVQDDLELMKGPIKEEFQEEPEEKESPKKKLDENDILQSEEEGGAIASQRYLLSTLRSYEQ